MTEINHECTDEIVCPHCGEESSDSWEKCKDGVDECGECGGEYYYSRNVHVTYETFKIYCKRDGHKWKKPRWMWYVEDKKQSLWSRTCGECGKRDQGHNPEWAPKKKEE